MIQNRPSMDEVMNSHFMKDVRRKMMNGEWSEVCKRCMETESHGGSSRRMIENLKCSTNIEKIIEDTSDDGEIEVSFESLDYRLGNFCNLKCRMCGPFSSDKWIKDWNSIASVDEQYSEEEKHNFKNYNWINEDYFIEEFQSKIQMVEKIHFAGGEPLISPQMNKLLRECIRQGVSEKISLSYNTNITHLPGEILDLWKRFKDVKLLCSIDGYGELNDYIRYPSKWENIDKNLKFLDQHSDEYNITEIVLSCTVQIYNVLSLEPLYEYVQGFKNIVPVLNLINLKFPQHFSIQALPLPAKVLARAKLKKIAETYTDIVPERHRYLIENISQIINFMDEDDLTALLFKFKAADSKMSSMNKNKLSSVAAELNSYLIDFYFSKIENKVINDDSN